MKQFSEIIESKNVEELNIAKNSINYINKEDLKTYLEITNKFLSNEAKEIIDWLIINNDTYLHDLDPEGKADNALAYFYSKGTPKESHFKELYSKIGTLYKKDRLIEIPVFQSKEQFKSIIDKKISPDEVLLDLVTEKGRAKVVQQFTPLIYKIIRQWINKSNLGTDDLLSVAYEAITYAMNTFGKRKIRDEHGKWVEITEPDEKTVKYSFKQYAAYCIANGIRDEIKHKSHLVRVPSSVQSKERKEKGFNTKNYAVSGDKTVGHDNEGQGKTLFDYIDSGDTQNTGIDMEDMNKLWKYIYTKLGENFKPRDLEIFYSMFGLNGYKETKGKDLAKKFGIGPSAITPIKNKIINFIKKDDKLWAAFTEILSLVGETKQEKYRSEDQFLEEHSIKINDNE